MGLYIRTKDELLRCFDERMREDVRSLRDEWVRWRYGIEGFSSLVEEKVFKGRFPERAGVLCRQIPSITVEDVSAFLLCSAIGLKPLAFSLTSDSFAVANHDKFYRVKIPWIKWSAKGNLVMEYEWVSTESAAVLEGRVLGTLATKHNLHLPQYHEKLREQVFGDTYPVFDYSAFFVECLKRAKYLPPFVFVEVKGKEEKQRTEKANLERARPPASWYYPLQLALFLGEAVLLETYENPAGGVPAIRRVFVEAMGEVQRGTGMLPLVLEISPTKEVFYCNRHLLEQPLCGRDLSVETTEDLLIRFEEIAKQVVNIGR